ncbi:MAG: hypothetical protein S4CHLAM2_14900 [Chlamydiales bacterium]|nr:hypothetical protein [Chlamydiales bacterium]
MALAPRGSADQRGSRLAAHASLLATGTSASENLQERSSRQRYLVPLDTYLVNPIAEALANHVMLPTVRKLGRMVTVHCPRLCDPLSTEAIVQLCQRVQSVSGPLADRTPSELPLIAYFDASLVVCARHLYILSEDAVSVLQIPEQLRAFAREVSAAAQEEIVTPLEQQAIEMGRSLVANAGEQYDETTSTDSSYWTSTKARMTYYTQAAGGFAAAGSARVGGFAAIVAVSTAGKQAMASIDRKEAEMRQQRIAVVADKIGRSAAVALTRWLIRERIVTTSYMVLERFFTHFIPMEEDAAVETFASMDRWTSFVIKLTWICLWIMALTPTVQNLHRGRDRHFHRSQTTVQEIGDLLRATGAASYIEEAVKRRPDVPTRCLQNFTRRVRIATSQILSGEPMP